MLKRTVVVCALGGLSALGLVGCASDREVDVTGSVSAPATGTVSGPITLEFSDVIDAEEQPKSVLTTPLDKPGDFRQTVSIEGDTVRVRAVVDTNGDGVCSAGELWTEADAAIKDDDTVDPIALTLGHEPCPAMK